MINHFEIEQIYVIQNAVFFPFSSVSCAHSTQMPSDEQKRSQIFELLWWWWWRFCTISCQTLIHFFLSLSRSAWRMEVCEHVLHFNIYSSFPFTILTSRHRKKKKWRKNFYIMCASFRRVYLVFFVFSQQMHNNRMYGFHHIKTVDKLQIFIASELNFGILCSLTQGTIHVYFLAQINLLIVKWNEQFSERNICQFYRSRWMCIYVKTSRNQN